jgi:SAM-dependent methyltransferase
MSARLQTILELLSCPDDGQPLRLTKAQLLCSGCGRSFPLHGEDLAEILPTRPVQLPISTSAEYRSAYLRLFEQQFKQDSDCLAWGAEETATAGWLRKRRRQVSAVLPLITEGAELNTSVLCDIAAGAGHYTFAYAPKFRLVLHCDLSVQNLSYVSRKAREQHLNNILFLRIDYFRPPFRQSLDRLLCLDTLIRGDGHDPMLLKSITRCLKPTGTAVIDFHNWWHNPLRRLGILPDNFRSNRSYRRSETKTLLREAAFRDARVFPFVQECDLSRRIGRICSKPIPSTRIIYQVRSAVVPS